MKRFVVHVRRVRRRLDVDQLRAGRSAATCAPTAPPPATSRRGARWPAILKTQKQAEAAVSEDAEEKAAAR